MRTRRQSWRHRLCGSARIITALALCAWGGQALAELTIDSATWDGRELEVKGSDGRGGTVEVYYGYDSPPNSTLLGSTRVRGRGNWEVDIRSNRRNPLDPVPCAVSAIMDGEAPVINFPVNGAPNDCAPKPQGGNNPPIATDDTASTDQDVSVTIDVLANDTDADGDSLSVASVTQGSNGSVTNNGSNVTYTPNAGFFGTDSFAYEATDGTANSNSATVTVTVNEVVVNNPPECSITGPTANQVFTLVNGTATVAFSATVTDVDNDSLDATASFPTGNPNSATATGTGTVVINQNVTYTSTGQKALSISAGDGNLSCTASVNIQIQQAQQQVCNISVAPLSLDFGAVALGNTARRSTTVTNNGDASCSVTLQVTSGVAFTALPPLNFNLTQGNSQSVSVDFAPTVAGLDQGNLAISTNDANNPQAIDVGLSGTGEDVVACTPADLNRSINSTSQNGCPDGTVPQVAQVPNNNFSVLAINDLGMHCGDLDTRIASILPPFQAMLAQVIQKGAEPVINPAGIELYYSATSNPNDPILSSNVFDGVMANGDTYKTNFWDTVAAGTYDPFYPAFNPFNPAQALTPLIVDPDVGLPVPNVEHLYLGTDGIPGTGDESLSVVQHAMPGIANAYTANDRQLVQEHYNDKPFFIDFPFGYVAENVNWYEGAGIPFAAFDDNGRENAYPLVRVEARQGNTTVSTVDTVLPISGEANCTNCHTDLDDFVSVRGDPTLHRTTSPTDALASAGLPVATSIEDPDGNLPPRISLEYAGDINVLRLHDLRHGANYVTPTGDSTVAPAPCDITVNAGDGDTNCLTNKALVQGKPVVCQVCHYTPALDLAHLGPLTGPEGTIANGRNHLHHKSNSYVMHSHHGSLPNNLFPPIPPASEDANGNITNQDARQRAMEDSCYQCHPGRTTQCLRGPMFNGGMLCSDCHGNMQQVGNDFTQNVTVNNPGPDAWIFGGDYYDPNDPQPRVPWANEPGCGSCHTGDYGDNLTNLSGVRVNTIDTYGNDDGIRLRQAFINGDSKATPIVPSNKRFAEPEVSATTANGVVNNGAGNPQLYRVSTGHGGVMCEGCHGATHAEWPNANPNGNDNVTATQLQGHTGTIVECGTCHGTAMDSQNTLGGPHGMHPVGDSTSFARGGHSRVNTSGCSDCHGPGSRGSNLGTVLSVAKADRNLRGTLVSAGEPVGCSICH